MGLRTFGLVTKEISTHFVSREINDGWSIFCRPEPFSCHSVEILFLNNITTTRKSGELLRKRRIAISILLGVISCVYRDLHHCRSSQWPPYADPKFYHWTTNPHRTQVMPNQLVMVIARQLTSICLACYIRTLYRGQGHLQSYVFPGGLEIRIRVIINLRARI